MLSPEERSLRARLAAYKMHSQGGTNTKPARLAWEAKFEEQVDPHGTLSPEERARRAEAARKAHYTKMAYRSARARSKRARTALVKDATTVAETSAVASEEADRVRGRTTSY
jgi:hypothetical protein